jgi:GNAT superfamily N-acetyltransferase
MTHAAPFSILLIHPPPATPAMPPSTLARVQAMIADGSLKTRRWDAPVVGATDGVERLPDMLAHLAARYHTRHFLCPHEISPARLKDLVMTLNQRPAGLRLSLGCLVDSRMASDVMAIDEARAIVQIQWRVTGPLPDLRFFKAFSSAGVWNHLQLDGTAASPENCQTAALQPNIIHSWETTRTVDRECAPDQAYGRVRPLPGRPLWQAVKDPVDRFLLADRLTRDRLLRLRIDDDGRRLYTIGDALEYHFLAPDRLPGGYLDEICDMVAAGGTVAATHVRSNLQRAHLIGYVQEKGVIVGNSSLKNPRPEYIDTVRRQSGLDLTGFVERGYTSVRPEYRGLGIGTRLLEGLTRRAGDRRIFSVIAEDNAATKVIARRNRTRKVASYFSEKAGKQVGIWMPEWMIGTNGKKTP